MDNTVKFSSSMVVIFVTSLTGEKTNNNLTCFVAVEKKQGKSQRGSETNSETVACDGRWTSQRFQGGGGSRATDLPFVHPHALSPVACSSLSETFPYPITIVFEGFNRDRNGSCGSREPSLSPSLPSTLANGRYGIPTEIFGVRQKLPSVLISPKMVGLHKDVNSCQILKL